MPMPNQRESRSEFNEKLLQAIDETIVFCLGETNANLIYQYLEKNGCPRNEIPENLDVFVDMLEKLVGISRGQILGASIIMENAILKLVCKKLGVDCGKVGPGYFPNQIGKLKEIFNSLKAE
jgi:hypothetical protein